MAQTAVSARLALILGVLSLAAATLGAAGAFSQALSPFIGFRIFLLGLPLALAALLTGIIAVVRTRAASGRAGASRAWAGLGLGALVIALMGAGAAPGAGLPAIHDITTDLADPPAFVAAQRLRSEGENSLAFDPALVETIREAYPDLAPMALDDPPARALARAEQTARALGWEVVEVAPAEGRLEAHQTSGIFRFVDDVVVRVRARGAGSVVDVRSNSRVGRGDVGANAARIRAFRDALTQGS